MTTRPRHPHVFAAPRGEHTVTEEKQPAPIYDTLAQAFEYWDILGLVKYDAYVYEDHVLWLLQNLAHIPDRRSVEDALQDLFTEEETFLPQSPEQTLAIKFLADEVWNLWTAYLHRREQYAVIHNQSRARMRQHAFPFPMSTIR